MKDPGSDNGNQYEELWRHLWANTHAGGPMALTRYRMALALLNLGSDSTTRMLDVGAGNGAFMAKALARSPRLDIYGAEFAQAAIDAAPAALRHRIARCDLQGDAPLPWGGNFDLVTCMEVLEHLPDDNLAVQHVVKAMRPGARLLVTVPAWPDKWGPQDNAARHVRRYEPAELRRLLERAGVRIATLRVWGGPITWLYMRATDAIGPTNVMKLPPRGPVRVVASAIYQLLKLDDLMSFAHGEQLLAVGIRE